MANLTVTALLQFLNVPDGTTVEAWVASAFVGNPIGNHQPPVGTVTVAATGTTASGSVTLTGLSAVPYWIRVFAPLGATTWFYCPAAFVGGDTLVCNALPAFGPNATIQA